MAKGIQEYSHFGKELATFYKLKLQVNYSIPTLLLTHEKRTYILIKKTVLEYYSSFYSSLPQNVENNPKDFQLVKD